MLDAEVLNATMPGCQSAEMPDTTGPGFWMPGCQVPRCWGAGCHSTRVLGITVLDARMLRHHRAISAVPPTPCVLRVLWQYQAGH